MEAGQSGTATQSMLTSTSDRGGNAELSRSCNLCLPLSGFVCCWVALVSACAASTAFTAWSAAINKAAASDLTRPRTSSHRRPPC